eukprot:4719342-Amphidinium_carterae.1
MQAYSASFNSGSSGLAYLRARAQMGNDQDTALQCVYVVSFYPCPKQCRLCVDSSAGLACRTRTCTGSQTIGRWRCPLLMVPSMVHLWFNHSCHGVAKASNIC